MRKIIDSTSAFKRGYGDRSLEGNTNEVYDISIGSYPLPPQELTVATEGLGCEVHKNI